MNKNALLWVEVLESGEYRQGRKRLKSEDRYCCLGVACELYMHVTGKSLKGTAFYDEEGTQALVENLRVVRDWLGLRDGMGRFFLGGDSTLLTRLNDTGTTFKEIAALIRSEPEGLFVKEGE